MNINSIKRLFSRVTDEDRGQFYSVQTLHSLYPRWEYIFVNCTDGFIALMERSNIKCWINEKQKQVGIKIENPIKISTIDFKEITNELIRIKKGVK